MYSSATDECLTGILERLEQGVERLSAVAVVDAASFRRKWRVAAEIGLCGLLIPVAYGGQGLSASTLCVVLERLGQLHADAGFNFALSAHLLAGVVPLVRHGKTEILGEVFQAIARGDCIIANAITEAEAGSAVYGMRSLAVASEGGFLLKGKKIYVSNAPVANQFLVYVLTDPEKGAVGGVSAFLLEREQVRVGRVSRKAGLHACLTSEIVLNELEVGQRSLVGRVGGGTVLFQESMNWERICLGAIHLGEMDRLMKQVVSFLNTRRVGGAAIGTYQAISHPLARLRARISAGRALMYQAAGEIDAERPVTQLAAETKLILSEVYRDFAAQLHQTYGAVAFSEGHPASECLANAAAATIYSGTSEVQCNLIARYLGIRNR